MSSDLCVTARNEDYARSALDGCDDDGPCTVIGHSANADRRRRGLRQRHRGPWRGFRRYVRGRSRPCRRRDRAGGPGGLRAAQSGWPHGADGHCGRHRSSLPVEPRGAEGRPQGRLSPDRDLRRDGRCRRRRRGAWLNAKADRGRARHRRQHGGRHHRISRRRRLDQAAACGLGGAIRHSRGAIGAAGLCRSAHGVRGRARAVSWFCAYHPGRL